MAIKHKKESNSDSNRRANDGDGNQHGYCKWSSWNESTAAVLTPIAITNIDTFYLRTIKGYITKLVTNAIMGYF